MADQEDAPRLLVLPNESTENAKILTLAHPRTSKPNRYYLDPTRGIYEFTRIAAPKAVCRSWLLKTHPEGSSKRKREEDRKEPSTQNEKRLPLQDGPNPTTEFGETPTVALKSIPNDFVMKTAEILVATPIDPLFILLPCLSEKKFFLSTDDLLDRLSEKSKHNRHILASKSIRQQMESRLRDVCDAVDAGDEQMYRLNEEKLLAELMFKAERMVSSGLPASLEERFIRRPLETPLANVKREESSTSVNGIETPISETTTSESVESQNSSAIGDSISTVTSADTDITVPENSATKADHQMNYHHLLSLRTALSYMLSSYVSVPLATSLTALLASNQSPIDFKLLDNRLTEIAKLRAEALAARSLGDFSRKRNMHEEDDAAESRLEKKKRMEEEEKKKKAVETRGLRDLKKVDTKGMKKMSDFFGRRTSPRKKA